MEKKCNRFFVLSSVSFILLFFLLNVFTPLIADDYSYSLNIHSIKDIFLSQYNHYFVWGGRNVAHFFAQFWLLLGKSFFNIANTIVYCTFILLVHYHITGNIRKINLFLFFILHIVFWFFCPAWGEVFIWLTGSCNYLWTTTIILFFLLPYRVKQEDKSLRLNTFCSFLFLFVGILAGWCNENSGAAVLFILLVYFIVMFKMKDRPSLFEITGFIGFVTGFVLLIAAPGNFVRADIIQAAGNGSYHEPFLIMMLKRFNGVSTVFLNNGILLFSFSLILGADIVFHQRRKLSLFTYLYALAVLAGTYSMLMAPFFSDRSFIIVFVFLCITLGHVLLQSDLKIFDILKRNVLIILVICIAVFSFSVLNAGWDVMKTYNGWQKRIEYIIAEKEKGNLDIEIKEPISARDPHNPQYGLRDIMNEKDEWPNTDIAEFYGLNSIRKSE